MSDWVERDIRWQRSQAIESRYKADQLRDEGLVTHKIAEKKRSLRHAQWDVERIENEIAELADQETRLREADRLEKQAVEWEALAAEHERHRDAKEAGLFEESA